MKYMFFLCSCLFLFHVSDSVVSQPSHPYLHILSQELLRFANVTSAAAVLNTSSPDLDGQADHIPDIEVYVLNLPHHKNALARFADDWRSLSLAPLSRIWVVYGMESHSYTYTHQ